jgi:hypothetical protein
MGKEEVTFKVAKAGDEALLPVVGMRRKTQRNCLHAALPLFWMPLLDPIHFIFTGRFCGPPPADKDMGNGEGGDPYVPTFRGLSVAVSCSVPHTCRVPLPACLYVDYPIWPCAVK